MSVEFKEEPWWRWSESSGCLVCCTRVTAELVMYPTGHKAVRMHADVWPSEDSLVMARRLESARRALKHAIVTWMTAKRGGS